MNRSNAKQPQSHGYPSQIFTAYRDRDESDAGSDYEGSQAAELYYQSSDSDEHSPTLVDLSAASYSSHSFNDESPIARALSIDDCYLVSGASLSLLDPMVDKCSPTTTTTTTTSRSLSPTNRTHLQLSIPPPQRPENLLNCLSPRSLSDSDSEMDAHWPTLSTDPAGKSTVRISRFTTIHYTYTAAEYHRSPLIPVLTNLDWIDYHQDLAFMRQDYQRWLLTDEIAGDAEQQYLECGWAD